MKIFYKYIFCLIVYVISFASTAPTVNPDRGLIPILYAENPLPNDVELTFDDESIEVRKIINKSAIDSDSVPAPISIAEWNSFSFDEILQEVVPSVLVNDPDIRKKIKEIEDIKKVKATNEVEQRLEQEEQTLQEKIEALIKACNDTKNPISEAIMKIAKGEGGHIAVARVILNNGVVSILPRFFLSGTSISSKLNELGVKLDEKMFFAITSLHYKSTNSQTFAHSERAIGLYLQHNQLTEDLSSRGIDMNLSDISVIQIKTILPMCHDCQLFWQNKTCIDGKTFRGIKGKASYEVYNAWRGFSPDAFLYCSNYITDLSFKKVRGLNYFQASDTNGGEKILIVVCCEESGESTDENSDNIDNNSDDSIYTPNKRKSSRKKLKLGE